MMRRSLSAALAPVEHSAYGHGYERMRRHAVEPGAGHDRHGLAMVALRGVAAWLARLRRAARSAGRRMQGRLDRDAARRGRETGDRHSACHAQQPYGEGVGMNAGHQKVTASHLSRDAYLYVRQSSLRQVFEHGESTRRQYALRERAVALGWPTERIVVIDSDLGLSGARRRPRGIPAAGRRGRHGTGRNRARARGVQARAQFRRLAPIAGDLRPERDADPRRGRRLQSRRPSTTGSCSASRAP